MGDIKSRQDLFLSKSLWKKTNIGLEFNQDSKSNCGSKSKNMNGIIDFCPTDQICLFPNLYEMLIFY